MKIKYFASTLLLIVMGFMFASCSDSDSDIEDGGLVNRLKSYMWEYREVSDLKDHDNGVYYETTSDRFYFMDNNICYHLIVVTDHDSYFGDSQDSYLYEYTYSASGSTVKVFDEDMNKIQYTLKYRGDYLISDDDCIYEPSVEMTQSQKDYIRRKAQEMHEEEENEEISSNIYDYVNATGKYSEEDLCIEFTINTELGKEFPGKSFEYGIEYGYGNYNNTNYCEMSGKSSETFSMSVLFDEYKNSVLIYMLSYNALREKMEKGEQLSESEIDLLEASVNGIEKNVNKFKARIFVEFDGERYYLYEGFYVTIDLDEYWVNNGGGKNENSQATGTIQGHEYVDLGLSVKWATCNVGADSPSDYGDYFAWGETTTKSYYSDENSLVYGKKLGDIAGNPQYDAACANWGNRWHLPTKTECEELIDKCTWTWTSQGGHNGYNVIGPNGNKIFLPAAGSRISSTIVDGIQGCYLSSTPYKNNSHYVMSFTSGISFVDKFTSYAGYSIRPVTK